MLVPNTRYLLTDDAERGGADHGVAARPLAEDAHEEVHVVHAGVEALQLRRPRHGHLPAEVGEGVGAAQPAHLAVLVVAGQAVVPPPLDVESHQVHAVPVPVKQVVGDIVHKPGVEGLHLVPGEARHQTVQHPGQTQDLRLVEGVLQLEGLLHLFAHLLVNIDQAGNEAVSESEGCCAELVGDAGVNGGVVVRAVA